MPTAGNPRKEIPMNHSFHLIPTFHHDIAYLRPESWYTETAVRIFDRAIAIMQENEEYTYTVEQAYFFEEYWNTHPEKQELLQLLTQRGQLHFAPGFFAVPDMSMLSGESLYMQAYYGQKILGKTVFVHHRTSFVFSIIAQRKRKCQCLDSPLLKNYNNIIT